MMTSMSRVREDTPQPTISVTDGTLAFSMVWGAGRDGESKLLSSLPTASQQAKVTHAAHGHPPSVLPSLSL
jgi:hypothetical protein